MAEVVKAWGREIGDHDGEGEETARRDAELAVQARMREAGLVPVDDVAIVKTASRESDGMYHYRCQAAVRAVKR